MVMLSEVGTTFEPMSPVPPMTTTFMALPSIYLRVHAPMATPKG
jgi:hypothetical protein